MFDLIPPNRKAPPSASMESLAFQNQNKVLILGKQRLCNMFEAGLLHSSIAVTSFATLQIKDIQASLLWLSDFVDTQGHRKWMPVKVQNQAIYELSIHFKHFHVDATNTLIKMSLLHKSSNCNASTSSSNLTLSWRSSVHQKQLVSNCNASV